MPEVRKIKKGLKCCAVSYADCHKECPYKPDCDGSQILKDALALIRWHEEKNEAMHAEIVRLQAERDAAVEDMATAVVNSCDVCMHNEEDIETAPCNSCMHIFKGRESKFKWRGVQKEG